MVQKIVQVVMMPFRRYHSLVDGELKYKTKFIPLMCVDCLDHAGLDGLD